MPRSQAQRQFAVATPLGEDVLLFRRMSYREELGRPFRMELDVVSEKSTITPKEILGKAVTVRMELPNLEGKTRYFNGLVSSFTQGAVEEGMAVYRMTVVPWLWFLGRTSDCRIFQQMTAPDIIKQVFRDLGFTDFKETLTGQYRTWEYCCQYRETALAFVSRLMEQEGIYFYFEHENGKHTLVLIDDAASHEVIADYPKIEFRPFERVLADSELIHEFSIHREIQPGKLAQTDYDFVKPTKKLESKAAVAREHDLASAEIFDYPGEYVEAAEGDRYSSVRLDEHQWRYEVAEGSGDCRGIATGRTFELIEHPVTAMNASYLIVSSELDAEADPFGSTGRGARPGSSFASRFRAIPATQQFRPARLTPAPFIRGPQTAVVVGPSGEEIHTDEHGRVKVMFHWDRAAKADENSSCFIRVSQEFAGKKWGAMQVPRIGQEVVVSFLEGDPDRPLITGRVYNGDNTPPYDPKQFGTVATWKTNSSKGGGGFNELRFEDKKDEEQVFLHAQKNMDIRVLNDRFETVVNDRHLVVENDKFERVKHDRHEWVDNDHFEKIKRDRNITVEGKHAEHIKGTSSQKVTGDVAEVFEANQSTEVTKNLYIKADNICIEAVKNLTLKVGKTSIALESSGIGLDTTGDIKVEAKKSIEQKATMNFKAEGLKVAVEGKSQVDVKSSGMANFEGTGPTTVKSSAIMTVQGSLVKIN